MTAAATLEDNAELREQLAELTPDAAKGGMRSMALMAAVTKLKNRGNDAFKEERWAQAAEDYAAARRVADYPYTLCKTDLGHGAEEAAKGRRAWR